MLELRKCCEHCAKELPNESSHAMICSFECTFCKECVDQVLKNVCPNCGGGFEKRPQRPQNFLEKYPMREDKVINTVTFHRFLDGTSLNGFD